jgi:hypothetical protein
MKRREFLHCLGLAALGQAVFPASSALAALQCSPLDNQLLQTCYFGLQNKVNVAYVAEDQQQAQWCWAACIEMVFYYYGFVLPQAEIVRQTWGQIVNLPAIDSLIAADLNRIWTDANGRCFQAIGDTYNTNLLNAISDLANDMPLILCTKTDYEAHAMVLTSLTCTMDAFGQLYGLQSVEVRDPWPRRGFRLLAPDEWNGIHFLTRIRCVNC